MAIESSMKEDMAGLGVHAPREADFSDGPREHDCRIPFAVMVPGPEQASERLDTRSHVTEFVGRLCAHHADYFRMLSLAMLRDLDWPLAGRPCGVCALRSECSRNAGTGPVYWLGNCPRVARFGTRPG